jgi:hypothetical protein
MRTEESCCPCTLEAAMSKVKSMHTGESCYQYILEKVAYSQYKKTIGTGLYKDYRTVERAEPKPLEQHEF